ncbi:MAG TPA: acetate--CoA ligase family protein, partial [Actinomycetota bacterium]
NQPVPAGKRVAILTNAGGLGIMCADACEGNGLEVTPLSERARAGLSEFLPAEASLANPVDMIASATAEHYRRAMEILASEAEVDALIVLFIPPLVTRAEDVARAVRSAVATLPRSVPVLTVFLSEGGVPAELRDADVRIPSYRFPEDAARALARAVQYGTWKARPEGTVPSFAGLRRDEAAGVIARALEDGGGWLGPDRVAELLGCYGLPLAEWQLAGSPAEAGEAARELGGPVALKAVAPGLVHKTEAGAVRLNLPDPAVVVAAAEDMARAVEARGHRVERFLVQRMASQGVEMIVGVVHDPSFGPVIACGAGGTAVELVKDVAVRITPLTDLEAADMIRSLRTLPLLEGYRGAPKADIAALEDLLLRVSALVEDHPGIAEMDLNPVIVMAEGAVIVDARVRVHVPSPALPVGARRT